MVAAAIGVGAVGSLAGGAISSSGAQSAAQTEANAQAQAIQAEVAAQQQAQAINQAAVANAQNNWLVPYIGGDAVNAIKDGVNAATPYLNQGSANALYELQTGTTTAGQQLLGNFIPAQAALVSGQNQGLGTIGTTTGQVLGAESPFINAGQGAVGQLSGALSSGQLGAIPNISDPSQLPGYQFALQQGLNATNNAASAQGLAAVQGGANYSGAQQKADIGYAEGLANQNYTQYLNNYWANQNNRYNMLAGLSSTGATAAAQTTPTLANLGTTSAGIYGNTAANIGNLYSNLGTGAANLASNLGSAQANIYSNQYANLANLQTQQGSNLANLYSALGTQSSNAIMSGALNQSTNLTSTANGIANAAVQSGANIAQSQQNAANLLGSSFSGAGGSLGNYLLLNQLMGNSGGAAAAQQSIDLGNLATSGGYGTSPSAFGY